jgi:hypothetical protein
VPADDPQGHADGASGRGQPESGRQRGRAPHEADRRRARSRQDRSRQARMAHGGRHRRRDHRSGDGRNGLRCSSRKACAWRNRSPPVSRRSRATAIA